MHQRFVCWDGPCEGKEIDSPMSVEVGHACAVPWITPRGDTRYAVYVLLQRTTGEKGLIYERRSYDAPYKAQKRVEQLMRAVLFYELMTAIRVPK